MSDRLLRFFEERPGQYLSGEEISRSLEVSRTAVWKEIEKLREKGYRFEAVPRKGYRLLDKPERMNPITISQKLQTKVMGRSVHVFDEVDSTMTKAQELVASGSPEGTLVLAEQQNAGKGRMGRKWHSPPGKGIWMSLILKPRIPLHFTPQLTLLTAVALCRAIRRTVHVEVGIKWPNDLLIQGRKISGILLESGAEDERIQYIVAGVGISVNLVAEDYPEELKKIATSLAIEAGHLVDREALLTNFLQDFEELYDLFHEQGFAPIRILWEANSVSLHKLITVTTPNGRLTGTAESIDDMGALCVRTETGELIKVYSGDVNLR